MDNKNLMNLVAQFIHILPYHGHHLINGLSYLTIIA